MQFLQTEYLGNTLQAWLLASGAAVLVFIGTWIVALGGLKRLARAAGRTGNRWDDVIGAALESSKKLAFLIAAVFLSAGMLDLPDRVVSIMRSVAVVAVLIQGGLWLSAGLTAWLAVRREESTQDEASTLMTMSVIGIAVRITLWSMILLLALDNMGVDVTALVAGLGVGGIAVALAAQSILGDLFASLSIVLDKPFTLGDFLNVDGFLGSVEEIGLKTTRVRSLSGEQVVFSNTDLLNSRIRNYGRMFQRRVVLSLGVTYQTPRSELESIPGIVREAIEQHGVKVRFDRSHMAAYGDSAIMFESVYYVLDPNYNIHMDIQQAILLALHEAFEQRGIEFAYPTQTVFLATEGAATESA